MSGNDLFELFKMILRELFWMFNQSEVECRVGHFESSNELLAKRRLAMSIGSEVLEMWSQAKRGV